MQMQIKLGRIFGIEIGLHISWFIIATLIMLSLRAHFYETNPDWGGLMIWLSATLTALLFFATLLAHEMSHSLVAKARGIPVRSIMLFALGGVSRIEKEASTAKTEFLIAIVGPLSSFLIGICFLVMALALGWTTPETPSTPLLAMLVWLGYINIALALFNLVPGFPLDGGRLLRALIWGITGNADRATRAAARVGQSVATGMILFGILILFMGGGFSGAWIAIIGWFLLDAAGASYAQVEINERLRGASVGDVMSPECATVDANTNLQTFVEEFLLRTGQHCFVVVENEEVAGIITTHEVKQVERALRPYKLVRDVMRPLNELRTVSPDTPLIEALETMGREDVSQMPVVSKGHLDGIISRGQVLQYLQTRMELNV
jgi:Zn-dependent protease/predicted transcriptional regulator